MEEKDIKIYLSKKQLDENVHSSQTYKNRDGEEFKVDLRTIKNVNLGTKDEPKWARFSIKANKIIPHTKRNGEQIPDRYVAFLAPNAEVSCHFDQVTDEQVVKKDGTMGRKHIDVVEKFTGKEIANILHENYREYKKKENSLDDKMNNARDKANEHNSKIDRVKKTNQQER